MKLRIVEEEADESMYWLELIDEAEFASRDATGPLLSEAEQLLRIIVASIKTLGAASPKSKI